MKKRTGKAKADGPERSVTRQETSGPAVFEFINVASEIINRAAMALVMGDGMGAIIVLPRMDDGKPKVSAILCVPDGRLDTVADFDQYVRDTLERAAKGPVVFGGPRKEGK